MDAYEQQKALTSCYVLVIGNPGDGFQIVGPFEDGNDANEWADAHARGMEWWAMRVQQPDNNPNWK